MATRLPDNSIQLSSGKIIYADTPILGSDLEEAIRALAPPQHFVAFTGRGAGGNGGGGGPAGGGSTQSVRGPRGFQGLVGPIGNQGFQGMAGGGGASAFEFVDKIEVTGAPTDIVTVSGLDGDADFNYWIKAMFKSDPLGGFCSLAVNPNGLTTSQVGVSIVGDSSGTLISTGLTRWRIGDLDSHPSHTYAEIFIRATRENTSPRMFFSSDLEQITGTPRMRDNRAAWTDGSANLTSLDFVSDTPESIGPGTVIEVYRIVPQ